MSKNPNDPDYDPYEIGDDTHYDEDAFNTFSADAYINRRDRREPSEPIPPVKRPRPSPPPFPQNPNASAPQYPDPNPTPGIPAGDFANFNPDAYLQQRSQNRGAAVNPNEAAPLEGFESPIPTNQSTGRTQARYARNRLSRSGYDVLRDSEPLVRVGVILFFLIVGGLLSICWIANITLLFWYSRR